MGVTLSNGKEITLYSTRFVHLFLGIKGQAKELTHFQNGEAFSSQPTGATTTMQGDFHSNADFFESEDSTGSFTINTTPASETTRIMGKIYHYQHDSVTPAIDRDDFFTLMATNDLTGEKVTGEGCRISGYPNQPAQEAAWAYAWNVLCGYYKIEWADPTDPLFNTLKVA
ncbi:hypothetical protein [Secundilactobacillus kimchicus]|uniref:hypothetical protein n=1 Tax=Secundilactobacillus kimchicus TaxID=528209 RepID=UPI0024A95310|nr:hypothetical protein [Secundilactobacillus kimchicus]